MEEITIPQIIQDKCPIWTARLRTQDTFVLRMTDRKGGKITSIQNPECCVVGEAHGFTREYWRSISGKTNGSEPCMECTIHSVDLYDGILLHDKRYLQIILNKFAAHLEKCHNPIEAAPKEIISQEIVPEIVK